MRSRPAGNGSPAAPITVPRRRFHLNHFFGARRRCALGKRMELLKIYSTLMLRVENSIFLPSPFFHNPVGDGKSHSGWENSLTILGRCVNCCTTSVLPTLSRQQIAREHLGESDHDAISTECWRNGYHSGREGSWGPNLPTGPIFADEMGSSLNWIPPNN